jgi:hypothetical protein
MIVHSSVTWPDLQRRLGNVCILLAIALCSLRLIFKSVGLTKMGLNGKRVHLSFTPFVQIICLFFRHLVSYVRNEWANGCWSASELFDAIRFWPKPHLAYTLYSNTRHILWQSNTTNLLITSTISRLHVSTPPLNLSNTLHRFSNIRLHLALV